MSKLEDYFEQKQQQQQQQLQGATSIIFELETLSLISILLKTMTLMAMKMYQSGECDDGTKLLIYIIRIYLKAMWFETEMLADVTDEVTKTSCQSNQ